MLELRIATQSAWLDCVLDNFERFLIDHASCERKASATGLAFVSRYPDRPELVRVMLEFAQEELEHFYRVYLAMERRGLLLESDRIDEYVVALRSRCRKGGVDGLVDSLLVAGIVEARSCERLLMVANALAPDVPEKELYLDLARAEARHHGLFFRLAARYGDSGVQARADELLDFEATVVARQPLEPRVH
jgi:tRNA-(ms[2]io[6]A)-hydroxylase